MSPVTAVLISSKGVGVMYSPGLSRTREPSPSRSRGRNTALPELSTLKAKSNAALWSVRTAVRSGMENPLGSVTASAVERPHSGGVDDVGVGRFRQVGAVGAGSDDGDTEQRGKQRDGPMESVHGGEA